MWFPLCALDPGDLKHSEKYIKFRTPKALRQYNLESKKMYGKGLFAKLVQVEWVKIFKYANQISSHADTLTNILPLSYGCRRHETLMSYHSHETFMQDRVEIYKFVTCSVSMVKFSRKGHFECAATSKKGTLKRAMTC